MAAHILACIFLACSLVVVIGENGITTKTYEKQEVCRKPSYKVVSSIGETRIACAITCNLSPVCKGFDYDASTKTCRLTETNADDLTCGPDDKTLPRYNIYAPAPDKHAFTVLKTAVTTYRGYKFLALKLKLPADGQSKTENWCRDYQMLCAGYNRRPTGCGPYHALIQGYGGYEYNKCVTEYNSDADIGEGGINYGVLDCHASAGVAAAVNGAFGGSEAVGGNNAFGFFECDNDCFKDFAQSYRALYYARPAMQGNRIAFTVCR